MSRIIWKFIIIPLAHVSQFIGSFSRAVDKAIVAETFSYVYEANQEPWLVRKFRTLYRRSGANT